MYNVYQYQWIRKKQLFFVNGLKRDELSNLELIKWEGDGSSLKYTNTLIF